MNEFASKMLVTSSQDTLKIDKVAGAPILPTNEPAQGGHMFRGMANQCYSVKVAKQKQLQFYE